LNKKRILAVGSVAFDDVKTPSGEVKDALGGSATFFSASARFFSPVSIVAVVGYDFPRKYLDLLRRLGVDTRGIELCEGKTFRWSGSYGRDLNTAKTLKTELNVFQTFRPKISKELKNCSSVFLANIDPDLQQSVLSQVIKPRLSACDTMNFWIKNKRTSLIRVIKKVDIFLCNEAEARELSGQADLARASKWILAHGPKLAVIKKGEKGASCFSRDFAFSVPAFPLKKVVDPTGAGDSFAGGFLGYLTQAKRVGEAAVKNAIIYGSVLASYNVESFSFDKVARLKRSDVERRVKQFAGMTKF